MSSPSPIQKSSLLLWAITSALAGFIFGFDLIVISGAEKTIQDLWGLSDTQHGWVISAAIWGTVFGSLIGTFIVERLGRKRSLQMIGVMYFISALGSAFAADPTIFTVSRVLGGIGIGISTIAAPLFISEISPAARRGRLTGMFQFNIVLGLLIATLSNALIAIWITDGTAWRWMLGIEAIPALVYIIMCFGLPESPRWLIGRGRLEEGRTVLARINPEFSNAELDSLVTEIATASSTDAEQKKAGFSLAGLRLPLMIAFFVAFFNQLSGINAILGYAPRIFGMTGIDTEASLFNSCLVTLVNLVFTLIGLRLIDKLGRRTLLYIGSFGYITSLGICAWAFSTYATPFGNAAAALDLQGATSYSQQVIDGDLTDPAAIKKAESKLAATLKDMRAEPVLELPASDDPTVLSAFADEQLASAKEASGSGATIVLICILAFIAAHAIGQGAVIWVLISEIFPSRARTLGQSVGSTTHWVFAALLTLLTPTILGATSAATLFGIFCGMMVLHLIWVKVMVPETKGRTLEDLGKSLSAR